MHIHDSCLWVILLMAMLTFCIPSDVYLPTNENGSVFMT